MVGRFERQRSHSGQYQDAPNLFSYSGEHFHLATGMRVRKPVLNVNYTYHPVPGDDRRRKEGFVGIFRQLAKAFKTRIIVCFPGDREQAPLASHPARQALVHPQPDLTDCRRMRRIRRAKDQLVIIEQVDQAGIALCEFNN